MLTKETKNKISEAIKRAWKIKSENGTNKVGSKAAKKSWITRRKNGNDKFSKEQIEKQKISIQKRREKFGYINSPETRQKISKALYGKPQGKLSKKTKFNMHLGKLKQKERDGFIISPETRKKIKESKRLRKERLGYVNSPETRSKMSKVKLGKKASKKTKRKMKTTRFEIYLNSGQFHSFGKHETQILNEQEKIDNCKIQRQYRIPGMNYVADGYCPETNTVYEVYERKHENKVEYDLNRQKAIQNRLHCNFKIIWDR